MTSSKSIDFDFSVFKAQISIALECNYIDGSSHYARGIYKKCKRLKRLLAALRYCDRLTVISKQQQQVLGCWIRSMRKVNIPLDVIMIIIQYFKDHNEFTHFVNDIYHHQLLLDDYGHLLTLHQHELQEIKQGVFNGNDSKLKQCVMSSCEYTAHHHRTTNYENNRAALDPTSKFYIETIDSLHFYIFHLFESGMRSIKMSGDKNEKANDENDDMHDKYFDADFARITSDILKTQHRTPAFERHTNKNTRFNIKNNTPQKIGDDNVDDTTYLDAMYKHLEVEEVYDVDVWKLKRFILAQEYESESVGDDICFKYGNILKHIQNIKVIQGMVEFMETSKITSSSFIIGLRFYYWKKYESLKELNYGPWDRNDHSVHKVSALYIVRKYGSFKEEIANYKYIEFTNQYQDEVVVKAKAYLNTQIVKGMRAKKSGYSVPDYDIPAFSTLSLDNLISVILYTDYSDLCSDFSGTFRENEAFESLKSIKTRNSAYYWMSRTLRETVEIYGRCRYERNILEGSFYCGMSMALDMPSINLRLCSPTSTSKQIEVVIKCGGDQGIILQLDNPRTMQYQYLTGFNCSFISRYKEEDERLFFGGYYHIKLVSVRIRSTGQNFEDFIYLLWCLDWMLSGSNYFNLKVRADDVLILRHLMNDSLNKAPIKVVMCGKGQLAKSKKLLDAYIYSTFCAFSINKTQINLNLYGLFSIEKEMRDLIMYPMEKDMTIFDIKQRDREDMTNLFKPELLQIFKNVNTMIIIDNYNQSQSHSFSLSALLSLLISARSLNKVIVICCECGGGWIGPLWSSSSQTITQEFDEKKCFITYPKSGRLEINKKVFG